VFDEMRRGVQDIEFLADPTAGEVRIGAGSPYVDFVTAAVARLAARYPRIEWYVNEGDTPICCRMLRERKIDIGIGRLGTAGEGK
jgi:DNA-binding transcriptional LysR family regulator